MALLARKMSWNKNNKTSFQINYNLELYNIYQQSLYILDLDHNNNIEIFHQEKWIRFIARSYNLNTT